MLLSVLIVLPIFFCFLMIIIPTRYSRQAALVLALVEMLFSMRLLSKIRLNSPDLQIIEKYQWLAELKIDLFLGVDGLSIWFALLSAVMLPICILAGWDKSTTQSKGLYALYFLVTAFSLGAVFSVDSILFYTFLELTLLSLTFMTGVWGGERRARAASVFFIRSIFAGFLMFGAFIFMHFQSQLQLGQLSSSVVNFYRLNFVFLESSWLSPQSALFLVLLLSFLLKMPTPPFHRGWVELLKQAPTPGIFLIIGPYIALLIYGLIRFVFLMFPQAVESYSEMLLFLATLTAIYSSFIAITQTDYRSMLAYILISQVAMVFAGALTLNIYSLQGAILHLVGIGFIQSLFYFVGDLMGVKSDELNLHVFHQKIQESRFLKVGLCGGVLLLLCAPFSVLFVSHSLILVGLFQFSPVLSLLASLSVFFVVVLTLKFGRYNLMSSTTRVEHGESPKPVRVNQIVSTLLLFTVPILLGLFPTQFLSYSTKSLSHMVEHKRTYLLNYRVAPAKLKKGVDHEL